jgi:hypothetical protein
MRLDQSLAHIQRYAENLGYLRLSAFDVKGSSIWAKCSEKVARFVVGIFAMLAIYDLVSPILPSKIRITVRGCLAIPTVCLTLNFLLKNLQQRIDSPLLYGRNEYSNRSFSEEPQNIKRRLLSDFNKVA